jgi:CSLREA domain-containing protein
MRPRPATRRAAIVAATAALLVTSAPAALAASPAIFVVTTAADLTGSSCLATCSLRQALEAANLNAPAHDTIEFAIAGGPGEIAVDSALPAITDAVTIDGTTQVGTIVSGAALPGVEDGLHVQASGTIIRALEVREFPGRGVWLDDVHDTVIGGDTAADGNVITANGLDGVTVTGDATAINNRITSNRIFGNGSLPIDLGDDDSLTIGGDIGDNDTGPNGYQNAPSLDGSMPSPLTEITIGVNGRVAATSSRVDVYWSPSCPLAADLTGLVSQAAELLGSVDIAMTPSFFTFSSGSGSFVLPAPRASGYITATSTTIDGTSELAYCSRIATPTDLSISGTVTPPGPIDAGEAVTFDLVVSNDGPLREEDVLAGVAPVNGGGAFLSAASSLGSCSVVTDVAYCTLGGMDPGESATLSVEFQPTAAGLVEIGASVVDWGVDPDPLDNNVVFVIPVVAAESVDQSLNGGESLTTDTEADGATPSDPIETTVTMPAGQSGGVTIAEQPDPAPPPAGYGFLGQAVFITTPGPVNPNDPYVFTFTVDGSIAPVPPIVVFRNGIPVANCLVPANPPADPDPCVVSRTPSGDDTVITVRTSTASMWRLGYLLPYDFDGFFSPVDNGVPNSVKAGSAVPVKFSLGGDRGLAIFAPGTPTSVWTGCGSEPPDPIELTVTAGNSSLSYDAVTGRYTYVWKTKKEWAGTCRKLQLTFADGSSAEALFEFKR